MQKEIKFCDDVKVWNQHSDSEGMVSIQNHLEQLLSDGLEFKRKSKKFIVQYLQADDIPDLLEAVKEYPQLILPNTEELMLLTQKKLAIAVYCVGNVDSETYQPAKFAAYLGAESTPTVEYGYWEMRTSLTVPEFRRHGLNSLLKTVQMLNLGSKGCGIPLAFTDDIPALGDKPYVSSQSIGLNTKLGLRAFPVGELHDELRHYLAEPCPEGRCYHKKNAAILAGQEPCACSIWIPGIDVPCPPTGIPEIDALVELFWSGGGEI